MSLNWDVTKVQDQRAIGVVPKEDDCLAYQIERAKTEHIVFASLLTGLGKRGEIGADDVAELYARLDALQAAGIVDPVRFMGADGNVVDYPIQYSDVVARIGLRTNVGPVTRNKFYAVIGQNLLDRARHGMPDDVARKFQGYGK